MVDAILVLKSSSSSLKFALFEAGGGTEAEDIARLLHGQIEAIGHAARFRVEAEGSLDGGVAPARITPEALDDLTGLAPLAPQHQPHNLAAMGARLPALVQVACFDIAFHATRPAVATTMTPPAELRGRGLRRYAPAAGMRGAGRQAGGRGILLLPDPRAGLARGRAWRPRRAGLHRRHRRPRRGAAWLGVALDEAANLGKTAPA